jgi:hypothetical protein
MWRTQRRNGAGHGRHRHASVQKRWHLVTISPEREESMDPTLTDRIRERAYEIWVASGCPHGAAEDHWLTAEREIRDIQVVQHDTSFLSSIPDINWSVDAPQAESEMRDAPVTALAAQSPMVKKSSRAPRAAPKRK